MRFRTAFAPSWSGEDESFGTCPDSGGIENSLHGHCGVYGSRGSTKGYRVIGLRTISAHSHAVGISEGQMSSGVSGDFDAGYTPVRCRGRTA